MHRVHSKCQCQQRHSLFNNNGEWRAYNLGSGRDLNPYFPCKDLARLIICLKVHRAEYLPALMFPDSGYLRIAPGVLPLSVARERVMTHHDTMSHDIMSHCRVVTRVTCHAHNRGHTGEKGAEKICI